MEDQRVNTYVLFKFVDTQNFGIGTLDSIAIPQTFQKKNFLSKIIDVNKFITKKSRVGVRWPVDGGDRSLPPKDQGAAQGDTTMMQAEIICFSEDHTTLVGTRDSLLESRKKPAEPLTNFYLKPLPKVKSGKDSPATPTQNVLAEKSLNIILVKLDNDCDLLISKNVLRNAIAYGKFGNQRVNRDKMISTIMKGLWDREFMASHSLSGRKSPMDKSTDPPKPALPADALQAIQNFTIAFWKSHHNKTIKTTQVNQSIAYKLGRELTAKKKSEGGMEDNA